MADQAPSKQIPATSATEAVVSVSGSIQDVTLPTDPDEDELIPHYKVRAWYSFNDRILKGAIAAAPGAQTKGYELIRVAVPTADFSVEWTASNKGARPTLPKPYIADANLKYLFSDVGLDGADNEADDDGYYRASGTYHYAFIDRSKASVTYPKAPYLDFPEDSEVAVQVADFEDGISNPGWPNTAAMASGGFNP